jgi:sporulation protein YlmC with PRC-barrel domain
MDIPINVEVMCCDGSCGHSTHVVLNPVTDKVSHVVVQEYAFSDDERLIPVEQIVQSSPQMIQLRCCKDELERMEHFSEVEFIPAVYPHGFWYSATADPSLFVVKHEHLPADELAIDHGARVEAKDGLIGHVDELVINATSGVITALVLREGHLWGQKEVSIPAEQITRIEDDTVYLKLSKSEIELLPKTPLPKKHPRHKSQQSRASG